MRSLKSLSSGPNYLCAIAAPGSWEHRLSRNIADMTGADSGPRPPLSEPLRAGRHPIMGGTNPLLHRGGDPSPDRWSRLMSELEKYNQGRASLVPGPETAQQAFVRFIRDRFAPALRDLGFKGSGTRFHLDHDQYRGNLSFQKSKSCDK